MQRKKNAAIVKPCFNFKRHFALLEIHENRICRFILSVFDPMNKMNTLFFFTVLNEKISQTVKFLIDHGADVNATTLQGFTALIYASRDGFLKTVKHLITNGAEVDAQTSFGYTALMVSFDLLIPTKIVFILHTGDSTQWIFKYIM